MAQRGDLAPSQARGWGGAHLRSSRPCTSRAGAYPATVEDEETERLLCTLLELGVNTFVCLQAEVSLHTPESAWRAGQGLRPYIRDAQRILVRAREARSQRILQVIPPRMDAGEGAWGWGWGWGRARETVRWVEDRWPAAIPRRLPLPR